jgi:hypothetical protein
LILTKSGKKFVITLAKEEALLAMLQAFIHLSFDKMKKKIIVKINWNTKKALKMASIARGTATAMTGNAGFPTPKVGLPAMSAAALRVDNAFANKKNGTAAKDELTNSSNALDVMLHAQAEYVSGIANGDETIIHSSGFESTSNNVGARLAAPFIEAAPIVTPLKGGSIKVKITPVANAHIYCFVLYVDAAFNTTILNGQMTVDAGSNAIIINSTKSFVTFKGLPAYKPIKVAVVVLNANGDSGFSPVATGATLP